MTALRLLTWNVWLQQLDKPLSTPSPHAYLRAPLIAEKLRSSDRDLLLVQKVWSERDSLIDGIHPRFPHVSSIINDGPGLNLHSGLLVASRWSALRLLGSIDYDATLGIEGMFANKGAAVWEGIWEGTRFQVAATQLQGEVDADPAEIAAVRRIELSQLRGLLDAVAADGVPQLVCGDFGIPSGGHDYQDMLAILGAQDGPIGAGDQGIPHTAYGRAKGAFANDIGRDFIDEPETLDYVLLRPQGFPSVTISRSVRRWQHTWKAHYSIPVGQNPPSSVDYDVAYHDLAYRYALQADVWFRSNDAERPDDRGSLTPLRVAVDHALD